MSESREERIRERAYSLWEDDGRPEGMEHDYWLRAEKLIDAEDDPDAPHMGGNAPL